MEQGPTEAVAKPSPPLKVKKIPKSILDGTRPWRSPFEIFPLDMRKEILGYLDELDRLMLKCAMFFRPLPPLHYHKYQRLIIKSGMRFTRLYWKELSVSTKWICSSAAYFGRLDVLRYARLRGCPWDSYCYIYAMKGNQIPALHYLHKKGCPVTVRSYDVEASLHRLCMRAVGYGCIAAINLFYCDLSSARKTTINLRAMCYLAASKGHIHVIKWLCDGHPELLDNGALAMAVVSSGKMECLIFYVEVLDGILLQEMTNIALSKNNLEVLRYLIDKGCTYNKSRLIELCFKSKSKLECLEYLLSL